MTLDLHSLGSIIVPAAPVVAAVIDISPSMLVTVGAAAGYGLLQWLASRQIAAAETSMREHDATLESLTERITRLEERHRALDDRTRAR